MSLRGEFNSWRNTQDPKAAEARQRVFLVIPVSQLIELRLKSQPLATPTGLLPTTPLERTTPVKYSPTPKKTLPLTPTPRP